ncbi:MAG: hypothetical protein OEX22_03775 [Cyclobacteriaceae bacterium]|nr:hypothetical protein [Cyclobacteriaceae bacterium]
MKFTHLFVVLNMGCLLLSCNTDPSNQQAIKAFYNIDSLINAEVDFLSKNDASLVKGEGNNIEDNTARKLDLKEWKQELEIFKSMDINQPGLVDAYKKGIYDDKLSNLDILRYSALDENLHVQEVNFYYLTSIQNLKKITAQINNKNTIYQSSKTLSLTFDKTKGLSVLKEYSIVGSQKLVTRDSLKISIIGRILQ